MLAWEIPALPNTFPLSAKVVTGSVRQSSRSQYQRRGEHYWSSLTTPDLPPAISLMLLFVPPHNPPVQAMPGPGMKEKQLGSCWTLGGGVGLRLKLFVLYERMAWDEESNII